MRPSWPICEDPGLDRLVLCQSRSIRSTTSVPTSAPMAVLTTTGAMCHSMMCIGAWMAFARRKNMLAAVLSGLSLLLVPGLLFIWTNP